MDNIYFNCVLTKKIIVEAKYLNENIDQYIENYLKLKLEGLCVDEGYIKPGTVKILKKSIGMLLGSRFTGDITYDIAYTAQLCNPVVGNIIECKVKFINKLGLLGNNGPITIIIGKQFHSNENDLNKINENDIVKVEVIAKKFYLNDNEIKIIAKLWNDKSVKKDIIVSDLTPILNDINEVEDYNNLSEHYEEESSEEDSDEEDSEDESSAEDAEDAEDDSDEDPEDPEDPEDDISVENNNIIQIKNPDEENEDDLDIADIDIEDSEESDNSDDSSNEY